MVNNDEQVVGLFESTREMKLGNELKANIMTAVAMELMQERNYDHKSRSHNESASYLLSNQERTSFEVLALCTFLFVTGCIGLAGVESTSSRTVRHYRNSQQKETSETRLLEAMPGLSEHSVRYFLRQ